ncbi:MAG: 50S ribosomal protein L25 [Blastocatellia bacterium]
MGYDASIVLNAQARTEKGKNASRRLRAQGLVPVTVYGHGDPATGSVNRREMAAILRAHGRSQIFTISLGGEATTVKIADMQLNPVNSQVIHADLMRILLTEKTEFIVPVHLSGDPEGVRLQGGLLDHPTHALRIRCLPTDLPASIDVDVAGLKLGGNIRVRDLQLADNLEIVNDPDTVIANCMTQKPEEAPVAEAVAEPEVAKKGKPDAKKPEAKKPETKK